MALTNEDLLAISQLLDVKLKAVIQEEIQPIKDDIRDLKAEIGGVRSEMRGEIASLRAEIGNVKSELEGEINSLRVELKGEIDGVRSEMRSEIGSLKAETNSLRAEITKIKLHLENVTGKNIQLLVENYVPAAKRYEKAADTIEAMQADIEIMKKVIMDHSEKLQRLA